MSSHSRFVPPRHIPKTGGTKKVTSEKAPQKTVICWPFNEQTEAKKLVALLCSKGNRQKKEALVKALSSDENIQRTMVVFKTVIERRREVGLNQKLYNKMKKWVSRKTPKFQELDKAV